MSAIRAKFAAMVLLAEVWAMNPVPAVASLYNDRSDYSDDSVAGREPADIKGTMLEDLRKHRVGEQHCYEEGPLSELLEQEDYQMSAEWNPIVEGYEFKKVGNFWCIVKDWMRK